MKCPKLKKILSVVLFLILSSVYAGAQTSSLSARPVVSAVINRGPEPVNPGLEKLLLDCLEIELALAGFILSDKPDTAFLIQVDYRVQDDSLYFSLSVRDQELGIPLYEHYSREELSFELDRVILGQARSLAQYLVGHLEEQGLKTGLPEVSGSEAMESPAALAADGKPEPASELESDLRPESELGPEPDGEPVSAGETEADEKLEVEENQIPALGLPQDQNLEQAPGPEPTTSGGGTTEEGSGPPVAHTQPAGGSSGLVLGTELALFLAAGEAGRYLRTGYSFALFAGYSPVSLPSLAFGVSVDVLYFQLEGYARQGRGLISTIGPALRWEAPDSGPLVPGFLTGLGLGVFMVTPEKDVNRMKIIPSLETALTLGLRFTRTVFFAKLGLSFFVENGALLYGLSPGFGLEL